MKDWNEMSIEEHINHLEETFRYDSSGTSKSVAELIAAYKAKNCVAPPVSNNEVAVCNRCGSKELSRKPVTYDCHECGATWQTDC